MFVHIAQSKGCQPKRKLHLGFDHGKFALDLSLLCSFSKSYSVVKKEGKLCEFTPTSRLSLGNLL
jgi:hypothetical protein